MKDIVLIDTNLYLDDADIIHKLSKDYNKILIPLMVLRELDDKKYHKELSYSARKAIQAILEFSANNQDKVIFDAEEYDEKTPDEKILASAKKYNATVATKDMSMSIQAKSLGLNSVLHETILNNIFNPYININMENLHAYTDDDVFSYEEVYSGYEYEETIEIFSKLSEKELNRDYWWFVIIDNRSSNSIVYANNPLYNKLVRIDNKKEYRELHTDGITVKAKDIYQVCAIYSMIEAPNVLICGSYGSGKSLLASAYALSYNNSRKTFISRPNLTVDRRFSLGFLPGDISEKMSPWMAGFMSSLYHIFSNTRGQINNKSATTISYDFVKEQLFDRYFEMLPLDSLQGMSFMSEDLVLLDEVQLCSVSILSVIMSRFGVGSKLVMTGDIKQTYGVIPPSENGLLKLLRLLPNKNIAYVKLTRNYRSGLIEIADKLQDKGF